MVGDEQAFPHIIRDGINWKNCTSVREGFDSRFDVLDSSPLGETTVSREGTSYPKIRNNGVGQGAVKFQVVNTDLKHRVSFYNVAGPHWAPRPWKIFILRGENEDKFKFLKRLKYQGLVNLWGEAGNSHISRSLIYSRYYLITIGKAADNLVSDRAARKQFGETVLDKRAVGYPRRLDGRQTDFIAVLELMDVIYQLAAHLEKRLRKIIEQKARFCRNDSLFGMVYEGALIEMLGKLLFEFPDNLSNSGTADIQSLSGCGYAFGSSCPMKGGDVCQDGLAELFFILRAHR